MPLVYADTSALFAFFHPRDEFSPLLMDAAMKAGPDFVYWSFLRYELRHNLRQARTDADGETAWAALRSAERTQARLRWQPDLKCETVLESADEFSAQHASAFGAGSADFLHVAAARRLNLLSGLDSFWTCDQQQAEIAHAAGLKVRLFTAHQSGVP
jgi:predicted nucleic acid-binding protein